MPHVVVGSCCADASCVLACPVNCIHPAPGEPGFAEAEMVYVDPATCVDCGACTTACPADAIVPHTTLRAEQRRFLALNAEYFEVFGHADRTPLAQVPPQRRLRSRGPFRVAVIGAGPAGMYTADALLTHPEIAVDVYDRLPTPYGLVRFGVAPDHQQTKQVADLFADIESLPGFRYLLNVEVGTHVDHDALRAGYDAVIYTVGAASDRPLGIAGEELAGSLSATDFVGWYNGHPDKQDLAVEVDTERAVVIGNGNVALDVARILSLDPDLLADTDIAALPLERLRRSQVREVVVLGRRGPSQAAFTVPELIGLSGLAEAGGINVVVDTGGLPIEGTGTKARLLRELAERRPTPGRRTIVLRFGVSPLALHGDEQGRLTSLSLRRNEVVTDADGRTRAVPTDEVEELATGLVLRAVGYRGLPIPGLGYDPVSGSVPHTEGRVEPGVYVAGWAKRGPSGFIGTNKTDAEETVETLLDDLDAGVLRRPGGSDPAIAVRRAQPAHVDLAGWRAIDAEERRRGALQGRVRVKIVDVEEAVRVAATAPRRSWRERLVPHGR
ncbi:FAD-dependent oxidoreductase [Nocardioides sp.]|uniref:FAD-dependent oxidoreductase n=1 Tax=Nocardioides sp. TaxID=35761 RepID=UPI0026028AE1|nr:FAD-dependent oxidoreductase [Nocardioides sp.]